jgi:hypothetical protein
LLAPLAQGIMLVREEVHMWLFTRYGFFSAVCARTGDGKKGNPPDPSRMMVRARDRDHLENLTVLFPEHIKDADIIESRGNDYRFRVFIDKTTWTMIVAALVQDEDYDNFKNSIDHALPKAMADPYHKSCMGVWSVMYRHQSDRHGYGIYDIPRPKSKGKKTKKGKKGKPHEVQSDTFLMDLEPSPFAGGNGTQSSGEIVRLEPKSDDDEVILVRNQDTGEPVGAIAFAADISDDAMAYDDAVVDGVMEQVAHPEFERTTWGEVKSLAIPVW